jgi:predicted metal-dependent peptidase
MTDTDESVPKPIGFPQKEFDEWVEKTKKMIDSVDVDEQSHRIAKARTNLVLKQTFFGYLALRLHTKPSWGLPTLATDGKNIFWNPYYVSQLTDSKLRSAIAHEVMHPALLHLYRVGSKNPGKWNQAGDHAINNILKESGFELDDGWLCDPQYHGMYAEAIYNAMPDEDGDGGEGDGSGKGGPDDHSGHGCGGMMNPTDENGKPLTGAAREDAIAAAGVAVTQAANYARAAGNLPGSLADFIKDIVDPQVPWQDRLRLMLEQVSKNDYNWTRPNRRYSHGGFILPSLLSNEMGEIVVAADTSGSVSNDELANFKAEFSDIVESCRPIKATLIQYDHAVQDVTEYEPTDMPFDFHVKGRGGTHFPIPFEYVAENDIDPVVMIHMTDGWENTYPDEPDYPVIWLVTNRKDFTPPFGDVIHINN